MTTFEIVQDNAGNFHLCIGTSRLGDNSDNFVVDYWHCYTPNCVAELIQDIVALYGKFVPVSDWEGNELDAPKHFEEIFSTEGNLRGEWTQVTYANI